MRTSIALAGLLLAAAISAAAQSCPADVDGNGVVDSADLASAIESAATGSCYSPTQSVALLEQLSSSLGLVIALPDTGDVYFRDFLFDGLSVVGEPTLFGMDTNGNSIVVQIAHDAGLPFTMLAAGEGLCDLLFLGFVTSDSDLVAGVDYGLELGDPCGDVLIDGPNPAYGTALATGGAASSRSGVKRKRSGSATVRAGDAERASLGKLVAAWKEWRARGEGRATAP